MNSNAPNMFIPGDWNALCDVCGHKYKASALRRRWDGAMCCQRDWEPRQPQDFVRAVPDNMSTPWSRPVPAPIFIKTGLSAVVDYAISGLSIIDEPQ